MHCTRNVTDSVIWVGGNDRRLAKFENLFPIPEGVSYNAYLILDDKTALMDTVDSSITRQFLENLSHALGGRPLDYLVVDHVEPDHCANIEELVRRYPAMKLVGNQKTFQFISQFYDFELESRKIVVAEGDTLCLGKHTLHFIMAPMVHWPEVMMSYEEHEKLLFSADAFGAFGALDGMLFDDEISDCRRCKMVELRRYYGNIVGKYGAQVQAVLKKAAALEIKAVCPLHGPVWRSGDLGWLLGKYDLWSRYEPEERAVVIIYGSMYGDTQNAAEVLASKLAARGVRGLRMYDLSGTDVSYLISEIFRCSHLVLASPTYNGGVYPAMETLLADMKALGLRNRTVALIENGSWAPQSGKQLRDRLGELRDMRVLDGMLTLRSALKEEQEAALEALAAELAASLAAAPTN